ADRFSRRMPDCLRITNSMMQKWSLTSLGEKLIEIGAEAVSHCRAEIFQRSAALRSPTMITAT
ncbi:MAG TPA: hypothetical protein VMV73_06955, partial [Candidatus Dormibacteraeota bacterium]|nr:hypothetical protein [Candidatus Dormibacteraeota bacterium]